MHVNKRLYVLVMVSFWTLVFMIKQHEKQTAIYFPSFLNAHSYSFCYYHSSTGRKDIAGTEDALIKT